MEESVWLYFGVIAVIVTLGILLTVFKQYSSDNDQELFFQGITQLGAQAAVVCKSPLNTMLSVPITVPIGAHLSAESTKVCGTLNGKVKCVPAECTYESAVLIDLTADELKGLFRSREYVCTVLNNSTLVVTCQG